MKSCTRAMVGPSALNGPTCRTWAQRPSVNASSRSRSRPGRALLRPHLRDRGLEQRVADEVRLQDHHPPAPARAVVRGEHGVVVRPPQPFQRHHRVVRAAGLLQHELRGVRNREQRLHRFGIGRLGVRVAATVHHQEAQRGHAHFHHLLRRRGIEVPELAPEVDLRHRRGGTRGSGRQDPVHRLALRPPVDPCPCSLGRCRPARSRPVGQRITWPTSSSRRPSPVVFRTWSG